MKLALIVAIAHNRVIGKGDRLPWRLPNDLQYFKRVTMGKPVIMGRKTYESIGRPLPGRRNIVVSRDLGLVIDGCDVVNCLQAAFESVRYEEDAFVIGGETLYEQALPFVEKIYLTKVDAEIDGDAFFPEIDWSEWQEISREEHSADERHEFAYTFLVLSREV